MTAIQWGGGELHKPTWIERSTCCVVFSYFFITGIEGGSFLYGTRMLWRLLQENILAILIFWKLIPNELVNFPQNFLSISYHWWGNKWDQSHQKRSNHTEQFILPEDLGWKLWSMKITYIGNNNLTYLGSNQPLHWQLKELDYYLILLSFRIFVLLLPFPSVLSGPERNFVHWEGRVNIIDCSITNYHCLQMLE